VAFTNLRDATREDWDRIDALDEARTDYSDAPMALLKAMQGGDPAGYTLNPYDHSRQAATRALRAGESKPFIVATLFHDVADRIAPPNHGQVAAEILRPFLSDDLYWMVKMHGLFQKENFTHHSYWGSGVLDAMLDPYRDHPAFGLTQRFCRDYDATSFDPAYDALPVEAWLRYRKGFANKMGAIQSYSVAKYVADPAKPKEIRFTYALTTDNYPTDPVTEHLVMGLEGAEWKVYDVQTNLPKTGDGSSEHQTIPVPVTPGQKAPK